VCTKKLWQTVNFPDERFVRVDYERVVAYQVRAVQKKKLILLFFVFYLLFFCLFFNSLFLLIFTYENHILLRLDASTTEVNQG